jgi:carbamoyltransferase
LGIAASQHNGAACLIHGESIEVAVQEERVTRVKRQGVGAGRPSAAVAYCLDSAGLEPDQLDLVVVCTQTSRRNAEHDVSANPQLVTALRSGKLRFISHHRAHALSALAWSGFEDAAILVADGLGSPVEDLEPDERALVARIGSSLHETVSMYRARGWTLDPIRKQVASLKDWLAVDGHDFPSFDSLGGMYAAFAHRIFGDAMEAGKVMGLAPYAAPDTAADRFVRLPPDRLEFVNALPERVRAIPQGDSSSAAARLGSASVQRALEEALLHLARSLRAGTGATQLAFAGGVALNAIANERLAREAGFDSLCVIPSADDGGTAYGAAIQGLLALGHRPAHRPQASDALGRVYCDDRIAESARAFPGLKATKRADIAAATAAQLAAGRICGWFQGRSEFGPRALGQRSILADPRRGDTKWRLDTSIKHREPFRPYAPVVLLEDAEKWFDVGPDRESRFMLRIVRVKTEVCELIPAVVHVDGSARFQTVAPGDGPLRVLLEEFKALTGVPVLVNTSFNGPGEAIVETPEDALACFSASGLDLCVIGDWMFAKAGAPKSAGSSDNRQGFLDVGAKNPAALSDVVEAGDEPVSVARDVGSRAMDQRSVEEDRTSG